MSTQHTPGPWAVNFTKFNQVKASNGALVATCNKLNGLVNLQANARLIAAAPELLAELEKVEKLLQGVELTDYPVSNELASVQAAITKATGEKS